MHTACALHCMPTLIPLRSNSTQASFLSNVDLGEHDAEQRGTLPSYHPIHDTPTMPSSAATCATPTLGLSLTLVQRLTLSLTLPRQPAREKRGENKHP